MPKLYIPGGANGVGKTTWYQTGIEQKYIAAELPLFSCFDGRGTQLPRWNVVSAPFHFQDGELALGNKLLNDAQADHENVNLGRRFCGRPRWKGRLDLQEFG